MIHRFQNIYGISYVVVGEIKDIKSELKEMLQKVMEDKKLPFSDVYVKFPVFLMSRIMELVRDLGMNHKEIEIRKDMVMVKF